MTVEELVLQKLRTLPPEQQEEVLHFVEYLALRQRRGPGRQSAEGLWADLDVDITEDDIAAARREMWGRFPHEVGE